MSTIVLTTARSILQICLLILSGVFASRIGLLRKEGEKYLNNILMHLALPAMILRSFQMDILFEKKEMLLAAFILSVATSGTSILLSFVLVPGGPDCRSRRAAVGFMNNGFIGIPLLTAVYGDIGAFYASVMNSVGCLFVFGILPLVLNGSFSFREFVKKSLNDKVIISIAAVILLLCNIRLPSILMAPVGNLADMTTPLALIVVGALLAGSDIRSIFSRRVAWFSCLRLIVIPLISGLGFRLFSADPVALSSFYILAATPTASLVPIFTEEAGLPIREVSGIFLLSTVASAFTIPLVVLLLTTF